MLVHGHTYDEITLVPRLGKLASSSEADTSFVLWKNKLTGEKIELSIPVVAAPMDSVTNLTFCEQLAELGMLGILSRKHTLDLTTPVKSPLIGASVTLKNWRTEIPRLLDLGVRVICLDTAHCYSEPIEKELEEIAHTLWWNWKEESSNFYLMTGNVAEGEAYQDMCHKSDGIRVGVGGGACCTTRVKTGFGVPSATAVQTCQKAHKDVAHIIADGGIKQIGDIVKAYALGADVVMIGTMFASCKESAAPQVEGKPGWKLHWGMASSHAKKEAGLDENRKVEGDVGYIQIKYTLKELYNQMVDGIQRGISYGGGTKVSDLKKVKKLVVNSAGVLESQSRLSHE